MSTNANFNGRPRDARESTDYTADDLDRPVPRADQEAVLEREQERFGGMKFGSAFFGWLAATGMLILLTVLAAAIAAMMGNAMGGVNQVTNQVHSMSTQNLQNASIWGGVVLLVIWFIAYYCGGYVAGRMARFQDRSLSSESFRLSRFSSSP